jgi:hypothetical protein
MGAPEGNRFELHRADADLLAIGAVPTPTSEASPGAKHYDIIIQVYPASLACGDDPNEKRTLLCTDIRPNHKKTYKQARKGAKLEAEGISSEEELRPKRSTLEA